MANCIFVETGQCGNQLGFSLLNSLHDHLATLEGDEYAEMLETCFHSSSSKDSKPVARAVCLDTEPKVINECLQKSNRRPWRLDPKKVAYRHGGAGNNWALGYEMASGEFLELSINLIRRELELCNDSQSLVFMHSVAGGTGSGLGTKISEACADEFPEATRMNIAVAPYHFGEVVVQHYNAVLCLSKISAASDAVLVFENEVAQMLCKTMRGIERPSLNQLNETIVSNLLPIFLPRYSNTTNSNNSTTTSNNLYHRNRHGLIDDITHLCAHPGYKYLDIKITPQTSNKSVSFTYDSWNTLLKTIQQMQLSGSASERNIKSYLKHALQNDTTSSYRDTRYKDTINTVTGIYSPSTPNVLDNVHGIMKHSSGRIGNNPLSRHTTSPTNTTTTLTNMVEHSYLSPGTKGSSTTRSTPHSGYKSTTPTESNNNYSTSTGKNTTTEMEGLVRSIASVVTLYGPEATEQAGKLQNTYDYMYNSSDSRERTRPTTAANAYNTTPIYSNNDNYTENTHGKNKIGGKLSALQILQQQQQQAELQIHELYYNSHSNLKSFCGNNTTPIQICASDIILNGYQRSTSVLANSQAILPLLQRAVRGGMELYEAGAYLHQYHTYGIEEDDFKYAFRCVGSSIQNYINL